MPLPPEMLTLVLLVERSPVDFAAPVGAVAAQGADRALRLGGERCEASAVDERRALPGLVQNAGYAAHARQVVEPGVRRQPQLQIDLLRGVHQVEAREVGTVGHEQRCRDVDAHCLVAEAFLGGDDDDAVRRAGAVNGRRSGVFQYGDVLDVPRVESRDRHVVEVVDALLRRPVLRNVVAFERHAVEHPQRVGVAVQRHGASDLDLAGRARSARGGGRHETGDRAGEHFVDARHAVPRDVRHLDRRDRRGQFAFLDALVSGHHHGVHLVVRRREVDREIALARNIEGPGFVAEVADHDFPDACGQFEGEASLLVGDCSLRIVVFGLGLLGRDEDGCSHERRSVGAVEHLARDLPGLLRQRQQGTDQNE